MACEGSVQRDLTSKANEHVLTLFSAPPAPCLVRYSGVPGVCCPHPSAEEGGTAMDY